MFSLNMTYRCRRTLSSTDDSGNLPDCSPSRKGFARKLFSYGGRVPISKSMPFIAAKSVLWTPPQSDMAIPLNPHSFFKIWLSK